MTETTNICPDPINCPGAGGPHEHVQEPGKFCEGCGNWSTETDVQGLGLDCCAVVDTIEVARAFLGLPLLSDTSAAITGDQILRGGDGSEQIEHEWTLEGRFLWPTMPQTSSGRTITMEVHMHSTERDDKGNLRWLKSNGTR